MATGPETAPLSPTDQVVLRLGHVIGELGNQNQQLGTITNLLATQGVQGLVSDFDGSQKNFREWVKSIEKYVTLSGGSIDTAKQVAYQTSKGVVSDFLGRKAAASPNIAWKDLKKELSGRFGDVKDEQHALELLKKCVQKISCRCKYTSITHK